MNYYRSTNRKVNGRYTKRKIDWDKLCNDIFLTLIAIWVSGTFIDIVLKAHGL